MDYGNGTSPILDREDEDLEDENIGRIIYSSNYIPFGKMDNTLAWHRDNNGASLQVYANDPEVYWSEHHSSLLIPAFKWMKRRNKSHWEDSDPERFNHLKVIIIEYTDGRPPIMYIGSHNYIRLSSLAGTAEVTMRTTNPELIEAVREYMRESHE